MKDADVRVYERLRMKTPPGPTGPNPPPTLPPSPMCMAVCMHVCRCVNVA